MKNYYSIYFIIGNRFISDFDVLFSRYLELEMVFCISVLAAIARGVILESGDKERVACVIQGSAQT